MHFGSKVNWRSIHLHSIVLKMMCHDSFTSFGTIFIELTNFANLYCSFVACSMFIYVCSKNVLHFVIPMLFIRGSDNTTGVLFKDLPKSLESVIYWNHTRVDLMILLKNDLANNLADIQMRITKNTQNCLSKHQGYLCKIQFDFKVGLSLNFSFWRWKKQVFGNWQGGLMRMTTKQTMYCENLNIIDRIMLIVRSLFIRLVSE